MYLNSKILISEKHSFLILFYTILFTHTYLHMFYVFWLSRIILNFSNSVLDTKINKKDMKSNFFWYFQIHASVIVLIQSIQWVNVAYQWCMYILHKLFEHCYNNCNFWYSIKYKLSFWTSGLASSLHNFYKKYYLKTLTNAHTVTVD